MAHMPQPAKAPPLLRVDLLTPFVDPLPRLSIAKRAGMRPSPANRKKQIPFYSLPIQEFNCQVHRDVSATRFWGYGNSMPGPTIEARCGEEILVEWQNNLPAKHFLPIDTNLMGAKKISLKCARWSIYTGEERRREAMAIRKSGLYPALPRFITIPMSRTPPRSGITITPWALRG